MSEEKQFAKGIYIRKYNGQYGEWLKVSIRVGEKEYKNYKFYPKKEQASEKYIEFYGVVDTWKPQEKTQTETIKEQFEGKQVDDELIGDDKIPF